MSTGTLLAALAPVWPPDMDEEEPEVGADTPV